MALGLVLGHHPALFLGVGELVGVATGVANADFGFLGKLLALSHQLKPPLLRERRKHEPKCLPSLWGVRPILLSLIAFSMAFRSPGLNGLIRICVASGTLMDAIDRRSVGVP